MAYSLVGTRYIGSGSRPAPAAGFDLVDISNGDYFVSNSGGTVWNLAGNVDVEYMGNLQTTGGTMTGAIDGATGFAPLDAPNFTTSAKLGGVDLATKNDLSTTQTEILNSISPKITEAVASTVSSIAVKDNIARATGTLTFTGGNWSAPMQTIPLPQYPDGTTAAESDCKWMVTAIETGTSTVQGQLRFVDASGSSSASPGTTIDPTTNRTFKCLYYDTSNNVFTTKVAYFIEGIRS